MQSASMAFVVIQHLSPDFKSMMNELLARHTTMPICHVVDGMRVEANHVYLLPPKKEMLISDRRLHLADKKPEHGFSLPIDTFLRSLAQDCGERAVAIVLSGSGSDGSRGVVEVANAGGLVICESEETAKFDSMPMRAQETGTVTHVLKPKDMGPKLAAHANPELRIEQEEEQVGDECQAKGTDAIIDLLREAYDIDFSVYKESTVTRRIERRLSMSDVHDLEEYVDKLRADGEELNSLYKDLLIGVTRFFRDAEAFEHLETVVIPKLLASKKPGEEIRLWVAGCATGEEAYSLAILLREALDRSEHDAHVKILATDLHRSSLDFAARGVYDEERLLDVSAERLKRFFSKRADGYHISQAIRELIVFAPHNLLKDAPFTNLDLISCRNLLIYFRPAAQQKVISLFHFGLSTGGYLFLGSSESTGSLAGEFDVIDEHCKVFSKRRDIRLPTDLRLPLSRRGNLLKGPGDSRVPAPTRIAPDATLLGTYDQLLDRFMPPSLLVSENQELLDSFAGAEKYLKVKGRRPTTDVLDMLEDGMKVAVAGALQRAFRQKETVHFTRARIPISDGDQFFKLAVEPIPNRKTKVTNYLITLEPIEEAASVDVPHETSAQQPSLAEISRDHINNLEEELRQTEENLQATIEELQTSNEELQATNEEMVASNEELQSTNEELHSVNEELYTVNAEHQKKIQELAELNQDMNHLLESTDVAIVFLDRQLQIRKFTPKIRDIFDFMETDTGRRISSFTHKVAHESLIEDLQRVLEEDQVLEREIRGCDGTCYFMRVLPYRAHGEVEGVVLSLIVISVLDETRHKLTRFSAIVQSSNDAIIGKNLNNIIETWNAGAERLYGYTAEEAVGQPITLIVPEDRQCEVDGFLEQIRSGERIKPLETVRRRKDGKLVDVMLSISPIRDHFGKVCGASAIARDLSDLKSARRRLRQQEEHIRLLLESTAEAIYGVDIDGICTFCNPACVETLGYDSADTFVGKSMRTLIHHAQRDGSELPANQREILHSIREGEEIHVADEYFRRADGTTFPVEFWSHPIRRGEEIVGAVITFFDITERKRAEEEIRRQVRQREQFLAILSHELRNPLHAVRAATHLLTRQVEGDAPVKFPCQVIERQTSHMTRLLEDLLEISRVTQEKITLRTESLNLVGTTRAAIETIQPFADEHNVKILFEAPTDPIQVNGDAVRLQQVQVNLLSNAIKYSPVGEDVEITVSREGNIACIRVVDHGTGIVPEAIGKVFDPFYQRPDISQESDRGIGVGLTLVRALVELHNGTVSAYSEGTGHGCEFTVKLPIYATPTSREVPACDTSEVTCKKVVLVEDQEDSRELLRQLLELLEVEVYVAGDGPEGVKTILQAEPDVAIVDIGLPEFNGYEVARRVRSKLGDDIYLVAVTGYGQPGDIEEALASGFDRHVVKPLNMELLTELLDPSTKKGRPLTRT